MPVESATYVNQLVAANPLHTDGLGAADSHLRLIKQVLLDTFPNLNAAVNTSPADMNNGFVPVGGIIRWSGAISAIPANWHLCDGTNGTPDLRGKFVIGADKDTGGSYDVGTTGGAATGTVSGNTNTDGAHGHAATDNEGVHNHGGSTANTTLTAAQIPAHTHTVGIYCGTINAAAGATVVPAYNAGLSSSFVGNPFTTDNGTGGGSGHLHAIGNDGLHAHTVPSDSTSAHLHAFSTTVPTVPPYYALA